MYNTLILKDNINSYNLKMAKNIFPNRSEEEYAIFLKQEDEKLEWCHDMFENTKEVE
jgi:hypothetical protein